MEKQTAIQELIDDLDYEFKASGLFVNWEFYLQREKEQMSNFANEYADAVMGGCMKRAEQYYNETYGKE